MNPVVITNWVHYLRPPGPVSATVSVPVGVPVGVRGSRLEARISKAQGSRFWNSAWRSTETIMLRFSAFAALLPLARACSSDEWRSLSQRACSSDEDCELNGVLRVESPQSRLQG